MEEREGVGVKREGWKTKRDGRERRETETDGEGW